MSGCVYTGTGDLSQDMDNQVKANSIRIRVLEDQNSTLRRSIFKMLQAQGAGSMQEGAGPPPGRPVPLWNPDDAVIKDRGEQPPPLQPQPPQQPLQPAFERLTNQFQDPHTIKLLL